MPGGGGTGDGGEPARHKINVRVSLGFRHQTIFFSGAFLRARAVRRQGRPCRPQGLQALPQAFFNG